MTTTNGFQSDKFDLHGAGTVECATWCGAEYLRSGSALRREVIDETFKRGRRLGLASSNLQQGFTLSGLGALAEASLTCDRVVQF